MRRTRRVAVSAAIVGSMLISGAGCSSDTARSDNSARSGNTAVPGNSAEPSVSVTRSSDLGGDSSEGASTSGSANGSNGDLVDALGAGDALDSVGIGGLGFALATALKAERHEIDGNTVHLYLGDGSSLRGDTACIVTDSILGDGQFAVIHDEGQEFVC